ncbi:cation-transporting P-type ATPase [Lyngbya sp. CCY1209]|uniref:cation-translocating P-type ATPase n=1 Tax=Lyngbya sp. CCY1209 TaxID=2886103 RepID=UPI002D209C5E|nr:cation-transporting P-type ATPase [Lyngbya sp. CCY1209]MEB3884368.1 cation-transporting P-type ATPase [Lyngbya sp. CCY1209]
MSFPTTLPKSPPAYPTRIRAWHACSVRQTVELAGVDPDRGLRDSQVEKRQQQYGLNELQETGGRSSLEILWDQFTNVMLLMLIGVAVVSGILDLRSGTFPKDAIAIFAIVILNGVLGYVQESRAEQALAALKRLSSPKVRVLREGKILEVAAKELVPGDVMFVETGVQIAADGRLIEVQNLQVRESALTGEAESVSKRIDVTLPEDAALGDRVNLVFQGTEVVCGRGRVIVTETGMNTEIGRIAGMLQSVQTEDTPLQQRMGQLAQVLVGGSLALVALVVVGGILRMGVDHFEHLLEVSLSMAVAVVPEGLPAVVTVTLAIGTQRMVRRAALIRRLPAVETLGSVTTICSDKTGTLTQNKMVVKRVETLNHGFQVTGEGYAPWGDFLYRKQLEGDRWSYAPIKGEHWSELKPLLIAAVLCNDARLQDNKGEWTILGDPTEGALLSLAGKLEIFKEIWEQRMPRMAEFAFSSERKRMSAICEAGTVAIELPATRFQMFVKGSPETILKRCSQIYVNTQSYGTLWERTGFPEPSQAIALKPKHRQHILDQSDRMAAEGLRVIALAYKPLSDIPVPGMENDVEQDLVWLGLVGMLDAPRPEVREAVDRCREAGIRPVMITGDHQLTAAAIARDLGIADADEISLTGKDIQRLSQGELEEQVSRVSVYARVAPEHKLRIVRALQTRGEFVAMTGDGVNDAPALKQADIGIAMGLTGTDVSKEASDMILLDDNFATIVAATEEGRVVYGNIRRFIKYILGSNIGEVLTVAAAPAFGLGAVPLTPLQILWMNLVTDGLPALALAMEPPQPQVMQRSPYNPRESIFARGLGFYMVRIGLIFAFITIILMVWAHGFTQQSGDPERWKTMVFTTLCLAQMGHAWAVRSSTRLAVEMNPFSNPYLLAAVSVTTLLQLMLIYVTPLREFFGTQLLSAGELGICLGFSILIFVWIEFEKLVKRRWQKN